MKHIITQSQMEELFAMKRQEKPPENFMRDFIKEFHRRMDADGSKPCRPSPRASRKDANRKANS
jgi:hypothetical protein